MTEKFDVFMKMLEIIERDQELQASDVSDENRARIATVIERIEGNIIIQQATGEGENVAGDNFSNISQSVIATRGAIATGVVSIRESGRDQVAEAIEELTEAIATTNSEALPEDKRLEAMELLRELTKQGASDSHSKPVLKALGESLLSLVDQVSPIAKVLNKVWPALTSLWT